jgi:hypothetical protein
VVNFFDASVLGDNCISNDDGKNYVNVQCEER